MARAVVKPRNCTSAADEGHPTPWLASTDRIGLQFDEAIAAFRDALPGYGLKLIVPPPLPDGNHARMLLSGWRRGETGVRVHSAASTLEALTLLVGTEGDRSREMLSRKNCRRCRGLGWYIARDGGTVMCAHANANA